MDNAIKFSQAGSVITVWVKEETLDEVYQALLKHNLQPVMSDYIYV